MNPEIRKHFWLDVSIAKVLTIIFVAACFYVLASNAFVNELTPTKGIISLIIFIWGLHLASNAIPNEVNLHTWEFVRQSSLSAWQFTWGKLLGATMLSWFAAILFMFIDAITTSQNTPALTQYGTVILAGLFAQALAMLCSISSLSEDQQSVSQGFWLFVIALLIGWNIHISVAGTIGSRDTVSWYGMQWSKFNLYALSLLILLAVTLCGLYRSVKSAFQYRQYPFVWAGFHVLVIIYFCGFDYSLQVLKLSKLAKVDHIIQSSTWYIALFLSLLLSYFAILFARVNKVNLRQLATHISSAQWLNTCRFMPIWMISLFYSCGLLLIVLWVSHTIQLPNYLTQQGLTSTKLAIFWLIAFLMLCRDIILHHFLAFKTATSHSNVYTLLWLFILYFLIPTTCKMLGQDTLTALFWPLPNLLWITLASYSIQIGVIGFFSLQRWRALWVNHTE